MEVTADITYKIFGIILVFIILKFNWDRRKIYATLWKCDGAFMSVFNSLNAALAPSSELIPFATHLYQKYKGPLCTWQGFNLVIFLRTAEDFQTTLTDPRCLGKADLYKLLPFDSLGTVEVEKWRKRRKLIQPSFNPKFLTSFSGIFHTRTLECIKELEGFVSDENYEISHKLRSYLTTILCDAQLSMPPGLDNNLAEKAERIIDITSMRIRKPIYLIDFIFNRSVVGKEHKEITTDLTATLAKIINEKRKAQSDGIDGMIDKDYTTRIKTILDILLESTDGLQVFSNKDLVNFIYEFIFAGTDTSTITLSATLMMISMHPQVQKKLVAEIDEIFGHFDRPVVAEDLKNAEYLDRVVKETMRLFPVASFIGRKTSADVKFQNVTLPSGVCIGLSIFDMHRNPKYWKDPLKFDPDRFLPEQVAQRHPYCYLPFSLGPRNCVGYVFGLMTIKTFVINLLRRFHLRNSKYTKIEDIDFEWRIVLCVRHGYGVVLENRNSY